MKTFIIMCCAMLAAELSFAQNPVISIDPASLEQGLYTGDTLSREIVVSNLGAGDLSCTMTVEPTSPTGSINNAVKFDGTNDYAYAHNNETLQLSGQLTIEAWINFEEGGGSGKPCIVSKGRIVPNYEVFFDTTLQSRTIGLSIDPAGTIVSQTILSAGTWYHVAFTYDGAMMNLYINGILDKSQPGEGSISTSNYNLFFAKRDNTINQKYKGEMDDVRIWNIARTQNEIMQSMNHELSGSETGLAGYWKFNEESGNVAFDGTSNSNNASLMSGAFRVPSGARIINWLNVTPFSMNVTPGNTYMLNVSFNAAGLNGGTYNGQVIINSNDPVEPQLFVPIQLVVTPTSHINLSATQLDFGDIYIGALKTMSFIVTNSGNDTLRVSSITCPNADYLIAPLILTTPPGGSDTVEVTYAPSVPGNDNATLTIQSNDLIWPAVTISLKGMGVSPPVISVSPESLEADLYSGRLSVQILTITNNGESDLEFEIANYVSGFDGKASLVLDPLPSWLSVSPASGTCSPGSSIELTVSYDASYLAGGDYSYDINVNSNDPVHPTVTVPVIMHVTDAPCIRAGQDTLDFGTLYTGYDTSDTLLLEIMNFGSFDLLITEISASPSVFTASPGFAGVDPGGSEIFEVVFTPVNLGEYAGVLTITSNDPLEAEFTVILMGKYLVPPEISVNPGSLSTVLYSGKTTTKSFKINNTGGSDLEFTISPGSSQALELDGIDSYMNVSTLNPILNTPVNQFTLECWVYFNTLNGNTQAIMQALVCYSNYWLYVETTWDNRIYFYLVDDNWYGRSVQSYPLQANTWIHVACTYNGNSQKILINGIEEGSYNWNSTVTFNSGFTFGKTSDYNGYYLDGFMDEIRIWNVARTAEEIQHDMAREIPGSSSGLIGYWQFGEVNGGIVDDKTGFNNDGMLYGNAFLTNFGPPVISWLSCSPFIGTCPAGTSVDIQATFDASYLSGGDYPSNIVVFSNDPDEPEILIPASLQVIDAPSIYSEKGTIDFGELFIGDADTLELVVNNNGSVDLLIFTTEIMPDDYTVYPPFASIDPGETEIFTITFFPQAVGDYPGTLTFNCNDPVFDEYIIFLEGICLLPPVISVSADSLLVEVLAGQTTTEPFTIYNTGGSNLYFNITPGEGSSNYALEFEGADSHVVVGNNIDLANISFTIEAWAKKTVTGPGFIFGQGLSGETNQSLHVGFRNDDVFTFSFNLNDLDTPQNFTDFEWHHWACTFNASTLVRKIYRDGTELANDITWANYQGNGTFFIGNRPWLSDGIPGLIDDVRIWNVARTQEEIQQQMVHELMGNEPGLVGYWNFDEGTGLDVYDKSPNGNDGTLINGVTWTNSAAPITPAWLSVSQGAGTIPANSSLALDAMFDATDMDPGDYYANITIASNDPVSSLVVIPVHMVVNSGVGVSSVGSWQLAVGSYPNPFGDYTTLEYELVESGIVTLTIFNHLGQQVAMLINGQQDKGRQRILWNAEGLPAGIYYYRLTTNDYRLTTTGKLVKY